MKTFDNILKWIFISFICVALALVPVIGAMFISISILIIIEQKTKIDVREFGFNYPSILILISALLMLTLTAIQCLTYNYIGLFDV